MILWEFEEDAELERRSAPKLRDDQRAARADAAAIVSTAAPKGSKTFDLVGNVLVVKDYLRPPLR